MSRRRPDTGRPHRRALLDVIAIAGHPVSESLARRAAGFEGPPWEAWHHLVQEHLVRYGGSPDARIVEPYHDCIRETAVAALPAARAVACHLARALEDSGDADPEVLARHHHAGGNQGRARELAAVAAKQAEQALAFDRAARLFRWALQLTPAGDHQRSSLLASLGLALANGGRGVEASRAYREAAELVPAGARGELRRRAAEQLLLSGHIDEGRELVSDDLRAEGFAIPRTPGRALLSLLARRALLRARGLSFTPRPESEIAPREIALLDHLWAVNRALSLIDVVRGAEFASRLILAALRSGERTRVFRGVVMTAGHAAAEAPTSRRTSALAARAESLAAELGTPEARGRIRFLEAVRSMCSTAFPACLAAADEEDRIFRDECTGMVWESWTSRFFADLSLFYLGAWKELRRRGSEHLHEARARGNAYAMTLTRIPFGIMASLAGGEIAAAREGLGEAVTEWSVQEGHVQHGLFLMARCFADLHDGSGAAAWAHLREGWPGLAGSLHLRIPLVRTQLVHLRGSCALASAAVERRHRERRALLREVGRAARTLERTGVPLAGPLASLLRAGAAAVQGQTGPAVRRLEAAVIDLDHQRVAPYAAAARWQLARLTGAEAPPFLPGEDVVEPAAMVRILAPGFAE